MKEAKNLTKNFYKNNLDILLKNEYAKALKDIEFKKLVNTLKVKEETAIKYTSSLEETVSELKNCSGCKSIHECKNKVEGFVYYPKFEDDKISFDYVACKYKKKLIEESENIRSTFFEVPLEIRKAKISNIDYNDKKRGKIIKWLLNFHETYKESKHQKGLYLHGSFGSGKTYLISALLNEISSFDKSVIIVYYPELLRSLKESFEENNFARRINQIKTTNLLFLDDIGAESITTWNRDEILGTILQYRMDNKLPTFFSSNLSIKELESHFIINNSSEDKIKARRIIERIKQITESLELISENKRK